MGNFRVDKIQAAACQIDTAIELLLHDKCRVSICILSNTALSLIKDLCIARGLESWRNWSAEAFPENTKHEIWEGIDSYWNFFKHANRDPDTVLDFDSSALDYTIFLTLHDLGTLGIIKSKSMDIFELWFTAKTDDFLPREHPIRVKALELFPDIYLLGEKEQRVMCIAAMRDIE